MQLEVSKSLEAFPAFILTFLMEKLGINFLKQCLLNNVREDGNKRFNSTSHLIRYSLSHVTLNQVFVVVMQKRFMYFGLSVGGSLG